MGDCKSDKQNLELCFGALAEPLKLQFEQAGISIVPDDECVRWQTYGDAIVRLYVAGLLAPGEMIRARERLMKKITKRLNGMVTDDPKNPPVLPARR